MLGLLELLDKYLINLWLLLLLKHFCVSYYHFKGIKVVGVYLESVARASGLSVKIEKHLAISPTTLSTLNDPNNHRNQRR
jgi:hypothetical protein